MQMLPMTVKPSAAGIYPIQIVDEQMRFYAYFDGTRWGGVAKNPQDAQNPKVLQYDWLNDSYYQTDAQWADEPVKV